MLINCTEINFDALGTLYIFVVTKYYAQKFPNFQITLNHLLYSMYYGRRVLQVCMAHLRVIAPGKHSSFLNFYCPAKTSTSQTQQPLRKGHDSERREKAKD